jgi:hypothetical protein
MHKMRPRRRQRRNSSKNLVKRYHEEYKNTKNQTPLSR